MKQVMIIFILLVQLTCFAQEDKANVSNLSSLNEALDLAPAQQKIFDSLYELKGRILEQLANVNDVDQRFVDKEMLRDKLLSDFVEVEKRIKSILGGEKYLTYKKFENEIPARDFVRAFNSYLEGNGKSRLSEKENVMLIEKVTLIREGFPYPYIGYSEYIGSDNKDKVKKWMEEDIGYLLEFNKMIIASIDSELNSDQILLLKKYLENNLKERKKEFQKILN